MTFPDHNYYKDGYFYRHDDPQWAVELYGAQMRNKSELIYETMKKVVDDQDTSDWAYISLISCFNLLMSGRRWPDRMNGDGEAKNAIQWRFSQILHWLHLNKTVKYRHQYSITFDPWLMAFVAAYRMNRFQFFDLQPQRRLWRPTRWSWVKYLRTGSPVYKKRFLFWRQFTNMDHEYVARMHDYIDMTL